MQRIKDFLCGHTFYITYLPGILGIATIGLFFEQIVPIYLIKYLISPNPISYYTFTLSNCLLYIMCFISYFQCVRIKTIISVQILMPKINRMLTNNLPFYTQTNVCSKEGDRYKPPRTSHCHIDGCVARFVK